MLHNRTQKEKLIILTGGFHMKSKKLFKVISIILVAIMLIHIVPQSVIAFAVKKVNVNKSIGNEIANQEDMTSKIVREVTELREESVKHFLCEDGSYVVATYSEPVHYKEKGQWKEINNSLKLTNNVKSSSGKAMYTPKAGPMDVKIPQDFSNGQKVSATNKGYTISFGVKQEKNNYLNKAAVIKEVEDLSSNKLAKKTTYTKNLFKNDISVSNENAITTYNNEKMAVENQTGAVVYHDVFGSSDLEYIVTTNSIKENIVVNEKQDEYVYSFDMDFGELTPIVNEDNSIRVVNPEDTEETIFYIEAPYMYDADENESTSIDMSLVKKSGMYVLTLQADAGWINALEREFPVVIDPTVYLSFDDVFVMDGLINKNTTKINKELRVGRNLTNLTRTYIKPTLPTNIPEGSYINQAFLILYVENYYKAPMANDISILAYDCYDVESWSPYSITWENQPYDNSDNGYKNKSTCIETRPVLSNLLSYSFRFTETARRWINGGVNNGIMLVSSNETEKVQLDFYSSRSLFSDDHPEMYIKYTIPSLSVSTWETDSDAEEQSFNITTGNEWVAYADSDWISLRSTSGKSSSGNSNNKIIVAENKSVETRTGTITVKTGNTVIGTITVTQLGTAPSLVLSKNNLFVECEEFSCSIDVASNVKWKVSKNRDWITIIESDNSEMPAGKHSLNIEISKNDTDETREGKITIVSTNTEPPITKEVKITQLEQILGYFYEISSENTEITMEDSSEYNHALATLAMQLSYSAYNPIPNLVGHLIPGLFMESNVDTVESVLIEQGFDEENIVRYNYEAFDEVAHIVAEKIIVDENGNKRPLMVVIVRGSVTIPDWILNASTQLDTCCKQFEDGSEMVLKTMFNNDEICSNCGGFNSEECDACEERNNMGPPIVVVTGHSLGAAVANLTAEHLNSCEDVDCDCCGGKSIDINDVYAYTFATPYTKEGETESFESEKENAEQSNLNIFNILNNNDAVTYMPMNLKSTDLDGGTWFRYGREIHITMPMSIEWFQCLDTAWLGLGGHAMPTYNHWMNELPDRLDMVAENISLNDLPMTETTDEAVPIGLLPKFIKVKCPVGVRLYDEDNNVVAAENVIEVIPGNVSNNGGVSDDINDLNNIINTSDIISWTTDEDEKIFIIPYDCEDISINIEAYDYGTMDFVAQTIGLGEPLESKEINNVSLYPGKRFEASISSDFSVDDVGLFYLKDDGTYEEIIDSNPLLKSAVVESVSTLDGLQATITIITDETVTGIKLINRNSGLESFYCIDSLNVISVVEEDNVLIWTIEHAVDSNSEFDVSVRTEETWHLTERVFAITV